MKIIHSLGLLTIFALVMVTLGQVEDIRCERWQGKWWQKFNAVRCKKSDGAPAHSVIVTHKIPCNSNWEATTPCLLKYSIGMWTGACGENDGQNRLYTNQYLRRRASQTYFFDAVEPGMCKEFYVFDCTKDGRPYDCYYAVTLAPIVATDV